MISALLLYYPFTRPGHWATTVKWSISTSEHRDTQQEQQNLKCCVLCSQMILYISQYDLFGYLLLKFFRKQNFTSQCRSCCWLSKTLAYLTFIFNYIAVHATPNTKWFSFPVHATNDFKFIFCRKTFRFSLQLIYGHISSVHYFITGWNLYVCTWVLILDCKTCISFPYFYENRQKKKGIQ